MFPPNNKMVPFQLAAGGLVADEEDGVNVRITRITTNEAAKALPNPSPRPPKRRALLAKAPRKHPKKRAARGKPPPPTCAARAQFYDGWLPLGYNYFTVLAQRDGGGAGRVYAVHYEAEDSEGLRCTGTALLCIPHSKKWKGEASSCSASAVAAAGAFATDKCGAA